MNYVLIITNELNGQTEIINKLFSSVQEAQQYVNENHLILQKIITETEYQNLLLQHENQKLMRLYQRPQPQQQQYPQYQRVIQEQEESEKPPRPRRPPIPVFVNFNPGRAPYRPVHPLFVLRRKVK